MLRDVGGRSVWLGYIGQYLLERYSYDGVREATISKDLTWFPPDRVFQQDISKYDTVASVQDFTVTERGMPMVLLARQLELKKTLAEHKAAEAQHREAAPQTRNLQLVFHLLDAKDGSLMSERISKDTVFTGFASPSLPWAFRELQDGTPVFDVYQMTVTKNNSTEVCQ